LGDLRGGRGEIAGALAAYEDALTLRPRHGVLYHKVLEIHTVSHNWTAAVATLDRLAEKEEDRSVRGEYHYAAARIAEDEVGDAEIALVRYQRAWSDGHAKAWSFVEKLLELRGDWKSLARAYRRQLKNESDNATLWTRLGDVLWQKLTERDAAISALEAA